jgi:hypothetical protein
MYELPKLSIKYIGLDPIVFSLHCLEILNYDAKTQSHCIPNQACPCEIALSVELFWTSFEVCELLYIQTHTYIYIYIFIHACGHSFV